MASSQALRKARYFGAMAVECSTEDDSDPTVISWGMSFNDEAHMVSADGRNYYALAEADNALNYVRGGPNLTPHLVWVAPAALGSESSEDPA
ncbi:hypothetical protein SAMN05661093_04607 [Kibdelosporangium aridum]|uniref:Uncharacterized protein n=1 Tax=Kibdelosporangium aridum TaxID=2030 RepID=A0A1W2EKR6_KIBAR|nr:hypothetical protein SAMN05661093_04607 [Kibdelosporangium aridum]